MKINLSTEDLKKAKALIETKEINMAVADVFKNYLSHNPYAVSKKSIDDIMSIKHVSDKDAFYTALVTAMGIDISNEKYQTIGKKCCLSELKMLEPNDYSINPYYMNIRVLPMKSASWELQYKSYAPYEGFIYNDVDVDPNDYYIEKNHLGFFSSSFPYLVVSEKDVTWMSITPNEIETMKEPIEKASGKVLVFGLGLGYFAYMCSLKNNVSDIVIVENDKTVIELFNNEILPLFEHKEKITVICKDAFKFAKANMPKDNYTFAFVDIWHNANDGLSMYLQMKKYETLNSKTKFYYWIEKSLLCMLRRCLITILEEQLNGSSDKDYLHSANDVDKIINKMYLVLKDKSVDTYNDLAVLSSDQSLSKIARVI